MRLLVTALAPLLATATAYAQAPGEVAPYEPPVAADPCAGGVSVMAHRWAVGVAIGGLGVTPDEYPDAPETQFRIGELAIRYRASRRFELELAFSGGRQVLDDDREGDLAMGTVTLGLRYRFMPEHRWNWWLMAGFGGTVIAPHASTEQEREDATRGLGMLGIGLERRFRRFALQAEVRGIGLGPREDAMEVTPVRGGIDGGSAPPIYPEVNAASSDELSGGVFTIGASYYF